MLSTPPWRRLSAALGGRDTATISGVALVYSGALSMQLVILPLLALSAGYSKPQVGLLTALSAVTQFGARLLSAPAMRRVSDRSLISASAVVLTSTALMLTRSTAPAMFVSAELVQGVARGIFWTAVQSHMVRSRRAAVSRLATVNFVGSFGQLGGPALAGALAEISYSFALYVDMAVALVAAAGAAAFMSRLPAFERRAAKGDRRLWSNRAVRLGSAANVSTGAWRGMVSSYIPVVLSDAGQSSALVGVLVAVANGASIAGAGFIGVVGNRRQRLVLPGAVLACGAGLAATGFAAGAAPVVAVALAASGLGAGTLQTLAPAVAAMAVDRERRGDAIAVSGSFRAAALFGSPIGTAGLIDLMALPAALAVVGGLIALPALSARSVPHGADPSPGGAPPGSHGGTGADTAAALSNGP